jgi:hypothetical protein
MEKVVPLLKPFKTIFYLKFLGLGKVLFGSKEVWMSFKFEFNLFERFLLSWLGLNSTLCLGPRVSGFASPIWTDVHRPVPSCLGWCCPSPARECTIPGPSSRRPRSAATTGPPLRLTLLCPLLNKWSPLSGKISPATNNSCPKTHTTSLHHLPCRVSEPADRGAAIDTRTEPTAASRWATPLSTSLLNGLAPHIPLVGLVLQVPRDRPLVDRSILAGRNTTAPELLLRPTDAGASQWATPSLALPDTFPWDPSCYPHPSLPPSPAGEHPPAAPPRRR